MQVDLSTPAGRRKAAKYLAAQGTGDDEELVHFSRSEIAKLRKAGWGGKPNPETGLMAFDDGGDSGGGGDSQAGGAGQAAGGFGGGNYGAADTGSYGDQGSSSSGGSTPSGSTPSGSTPSNSTDMAAAVAAMLAGQFSALGSTPEDIASAGQAVAQGIATAYGAPVGMVGAALAAAGLPGFDSYASSLSTGGAQGPSTGGQGGNLNDLANFGKAVGPGGLTGTVPMNGGTSTPPLDSLSTMTPPPTPTAADFGTTSGGTIPTQLARTPTNATNAEGALLPNMSGSPQGIAIQGQANKDPKLAALIAMGNATGGQNYGAEGR